MIRPRHDLNRLPLYTPGQAVPGAVKLSSNENPLGPSPEALKAFRNYSDLAVYPDSSGRALREALGEKFDIPPEQVLLGNGSDELICLTALSFLDEGDRALIFTPTFSEYAFAVRLSGHSADTVPLREGRFSPDLIKPDLSPSVKILYLCSPNNPTGTSISLSDLETVLRQNPDRLVVWDAAYAEYAEAADYPSPADFKTLRETYPQLLQLRTFSKIYGLAGLRIGYALGSPPVIEALRRTKQPFNINAPAQAAALAALKDRDHTEKSRALNREGKEFLSRELEKRGLFFYPGEGNFLAFDLKRETEPLCPHFHAGGIVPRSLRSFGLPAFLRLTIGYRKDLEQFLRILDTLPA